MNTHKPYNLFNDIEQTAGLRKKHIALIDGDRSISYTEMLKAAKFAASAFKLAGIKDYAKCVLIANDSPEYIFASLGILACQGVFVSAGKEITNTGFNELLSRISVDFAILEKSFCKKLIPKSYKECKSFNVGEKEFCVFRKENLGSGPGLLTSPQESQSTEPIPKQNLSEQFAKINPAFIRFTSGTTAESKGVVLSHQTIKERTECANFALQITEKDRVLWMLPMAYHFAVTIMLFLRKGCTIDIAIDATPKSVIAKLQNKITTFVYATPYHYGNMVRDPKLNKKTQNIPDSVRLLISTAMPLTEELFAKFAKKFNRYLNQAYGIIECGLPCVNTDPNEENGLSVGRHLSGYQLRIALKQDADTSGEILIKGAGFFDAYFDPWQKRDKALLKGWFHTGDIGRFGADGTVQIIGREKSVINFLGLKVFPEDVERVLISHPSVSEAKVLGEEHPDFGQIVVAEIVPKKGVKVDTIKLTKFCAESLSQQEIPQDFRSVKKISKTASGKLKR